MMLTNNTGSLVVTPIIESVQLRVYRHRSEIGDTGRTRQSGFLRLRLDPQQLFAETSGLRRLEGTQRVAAIRFEPRSMFEVGFQVGSCNNCHGEAGVFSLQTYARRFGPRSMSPWFEPSKVSGQNELTTRWKRGDYTWGLLTGFANANHAPAASN